MIIEEILLGKDEADKKKKINDNLGKEVIINDEHNFWVHGTLIKEGSDDQVYQIDLFNAMGKTHLSYHDLNQLLVLTEYKP